MTIKNRLCPVCLMLVLLTGTGTAGAQLLDLGKEEEARVRSYDRNEVPGHYTIGFYADDRGSSTKLQLPKDVDTFEVWVGITGDSTRVFSALVMRLELPPGVELAGPVAWIPRDGLKESGELLAEGMMAEFPHDCAQQKGPAPVMLGRIPLRMQPGISEATLTPGAHSQHGLSVELCRDDDAWPKPYAEPVSLEVKRQRSLWDRLTGWFN